MNTALFRRGPAALVPTLLGAVCLSALAGCYSSGPGYAAGPEPVIVRGPDAYVYYPGYEVYYNSTRRVYVYREGNAWVTHREPPRAWARDIPRAPSVHVDFHDAPERHHAEVIRTYPKTWKQPPKDPHQNHDRKDDRKGDHDHDDRQH